MPCSCSLSCVKLIYITLIHDIYFFLDDKKKYTILKTKNKIIIQL